jgi:hypothetical protein
VGGQKNFIEVIDYSSSMVDRRNFRGSELRSQRRFWIARSGDNGNGGDRSAQLNTKNNANLTKGYKIYVMLDLNRIRLSSGKSNWLQAVWKVSLRYLNLFTHHNYYESEAIFQPVASS